MMLKLKADVLLLPKVNEMRRLTQPSTGDDRHGSSYGTRDG